MEALWYESLMVENHLDIRSAYVLNRGLQVPNTFILFRSDCTGLECYI